MHAWMKVSPWPTDHSASLAARCVASGVLGLCLLQALLYCGLPGPSQEVRTKEWRHTEASM